MFATHTKGLTVHTDTAMYMKHTAGFPTYIVGSLINV